MFSPQAILAALHGVPSMSARTFSIILEKFSLPDFADWRISDFLKVGIESKRASQIFQEIQLLQPAVADRILQRDQIQVLTIKDSLYPQTLKEIASPPNLLYVRGNPAGLHQIALAVVGTRLPSPYGLAVTEKLVAPVARHGISIVSGLALGIDGVAHRSALQAGGTTVAILGTGVDMIYPWQHQSLAEDILAHGGAIVSEFPLGSKPERHHFPQRNRIIAGLARATLLIEAGDKSGALITAKFALDANRDVLAVPGSITWPLSIGPNNWIRLGATLIRNAEDILEIFEPQTLPLPIHHTQNPTPLPSSPRPSIPPIFDSPEQAQVYALLKHEPTHIDEIVEKSRLDPSVVSATFALLEINGTVRHLGGQYYTRV